MVDSQSHYELYNLSLLSELLISDRNKFPIGNFFYCVGIISNYQIKNYKEKNVWWIECLSSNLMKHGIVEKWNLRNYNLTGDRRTANEGGRWKNTII